MSVPALSDIKTSNTDVKWQREKPFPIRKIYIFRYIVNYIVKQLKPERFLQVHVVGTDYLKWGLYSPCTNYLRIIGMLKFYAFEYFKYSTFDYKHFRDCLHYNKLSDIVPIGKF